jgi:hypothetical protein
MSKALVENELFNLLRKKDLLLQTPGCQEQITKLDILIGHLQATHGPVQPKHHEGITSMNSELLENLTVEDREIPGQAISDTAAKAFSALQQKRERDYAAACADFDKELTALAGESADLEAESKRTPERLASVERVLRFRADELIAQGEPEQARAKLAELEESKGELAKIEQRRAEIAERCRQVEAEKKEALRRTAEDFREASVLLIRATEGALASILDGTRDTLNSLEAQIGASVYQPGDLTADEKSPTWVTLNRLYAGRTR